MIFKQIKKFFEAVDNQITLLISGIKYGLISSETSFKKQMIFVNL